MRHNYFFQSFFFLFFLLVLLDHFCYMLTTHRGPHLQSACGNVDQFDRSGYRAFNVAWLYGVERQWKIRKSEERYQFFFC